ncbi:hypothetical protein [Clostridium sp.]|mgnify:CR=1 FL=1|jgi:hypothetical protein|uniref:hypothetical protein n=1 Tax=Clostridium sp. TaxID=1506 RepID=UPI002FDD999D
MHNKIINGLKNFFKKNSTKNIDIDKLKSENLCLGVESPDKSTKIVDTAFTKSQQNFNVTPEQLKILEKIAGSSNV